MNEIVVDAATAAKLAGLRGSVRLVDDAGNMLAVAQAAVPPSPEVREWAKGPFPPGAFAPFTDEEVRPSLDALSRGEPGVTTAELLAKLRAL